MCPFSLISIAYFCRCTAPFSAARWHHVLIASAASYIGVITQKKVARLVSREPPAGKDKESHWEKLFVDGKLSSLGIFDSYKENIFKTGFPLTSVIKWMLIL